MQQCHHPVSLQLGEFFGSRLLPRMGEEGLILGAWGDRERAQLSVHHHLLCSVQHFSPRQCLCFSRAT